MKTTIIRPIMKAHHHQPIQIAIVSLLCCLPGCLSTAHRIDRHLAANPGRPASIINALHNRDVVTGMLQAEVRLGIGAASAH
jgi:hypothetical protein